MAEIDQLQIRSGQLENLNSITLLDGEFGFTEDTLRLYIGSASGINIAQPNMSDLNALTTSINGAISIATNAYKYVGTISTATNDTGAIVLNNYNILKSIQAYTATANNTSVIPIPVEIYSIVDLTQAVIDVYYKGLLKDLDTDYTIDYTNNNIILNGFVMASGEKLKYRVFK